MSQIWKADRGDMWSLGEFRPDLPGLDGIRGLVPRWDIEDPVRIAFEAWLKPRLVGGCAEVHVRSPLHHWALAHGYDRTVLAWHHDGTSYGQDLMVVWSNEASTEIRRHPKRGTIYQAAPYEVLVFDNMKFWHRTPTKDNQKDWSNRWLIRTFLRSGARLRDTDDLYMLEAA